jgi:hypothetical protein
LVFGQEEETGEEPNIPDVNVSIGEDTTNIRDTTLRVETVTKTF